MARLLLTVQEILPKYPGLPLVANSADFTWTAAGADFADGFMFPMTGREILLVRNDNVAAQTVTIDSSLDPFGREGDITAYSVGIGEYAVFPNFPRQGWATATGYLYGAAAATDVMLAVLRLPN